MARKITQRERVVAELAAIRALQSEPPTFFREHDHRRLRDAWAKKSAELVELELKFYSQRARF
ncbi:MAG: hypothetical protein IAE94_01730 [Chthoniobacterales bacterium]|nr:hypothetical protein [Chthoniobacterales bacterium]